MKTSEIIKVVVEKRKLGYDCIICDGSTCKECSFDDKLLKYNNNCVGVFTSPFNKTDKLMKGDEK